MEGYFMFQWGGFIFTWGVPHGGIGFHRGGGLKKIIGWGAPPHNPPTMGNPVEWVSKSLWH